MNKKKSINYHLHTPRLAVDNQSWMLSYMMFLNSMIYHNIAFPLCWLLEKYGSYNINIIYYNIVCPLHMILRKYVSYDVNTKSHNTACPLHMLLGKYVTYNVNIISHNTACPLCWLLGKYVTCNVNVISHWDRKILSANFHTWKRKDCSNDFWAVVYLFLKM